MKIDRFVKVMLVLIALLLALNCAKVLNSPSEAAAPPAFLQVGKSYVFQTQGGNAMEVLDIQNTGWIKAKSYDGSVYWVNTNVCDSIRPR